MLHVEPLLTRATEALRSAQETIDLVERARLTVLALHCLEKFEARRIARPAE